MKNPARKWTNIVYTISTLVLLVGGVYGLLAGNLRMVGIALLFLTASAGAGVWRLNLLWDALIRFVKEEGKQ